MRILCCYFNEPILNYLFVITNPRKKYNKILMVSTIEKSFKIGNV